MKTAKPRIRVDFINGVARFTKTTLVKAISILRQDSTLDSSKMDNSFIESVYSDLKGTYLNYPGSKTINVVYRGNSAVLGVQDDFRITYPNQYMGAHISDILPQFLASFIKSCILDSKGTSDLDSEEDLFV